jgi:hypothetical protein
MRKAADSKKEPVQFYSGTLISRAKATDFPKRGIDEDNVNARDCRALLLGPVTKKSSPHPRPPNLFFS